MAYGIVGVDDIDQFSEFISTVSLGDVSNALAVGDNKQISITWTDPTDAILSNGATISRWAGTLVVRKAGSAPANKNDGTIILNSTTRNAYSSTPYVDTGLTNGTVYYYRFFPYSQSSVFTDGTAIAGLPHTVKIDIPTITIPGGKFTYDGSVKTPTVNYNSSYISVAGELSATNAGEHIVTATLKNATHAWSDGTIGTKSISWNINKATGVISVDTELIKLSLRQPSGTATITQVGDGTLSATSNNSALVVASVPNSTTLQVSRLGTTEGQTTVTLYAAESSNYTAAEPVTITVTAYNYKTMTVTINEADSNPATCCTYYDDALEMEAGSDAWDEFFGHYPVLFKDGQEVVKINPNNFAQDINGNSIDITSGNSGDVMIAFPRRGLTMSKTGDIVTIKMTDDPDSSDFEYMAHRRGDTQKDVFYIGAYIGSVINNKLRSLSEKTPQTSITLSQCISYGKGLGASDGNGGSGYDIEGWYQLTYTQCMYVLKYKNLNSQAVIGNGVSSGSHVTVGSLNTKGMDWGDTSNTTTQVKLFGIEDRWGNYWQFIGGLCHSSNYHILTATENFNDTGSGYIDRGASGFSGGTDWKWLKQIQGTTHGGFLLKSTTEGSDTTYYCDISCFNATPVLLFGTKNSYDTRSGIFSLDIRESASYTGDSGCRLMYL